MNCNSIKEGYVSKHAIFLMALMVISFCCVILMNKPLFALSLEVNPARASRNVNGKIRIHINLKGAVNLLSCGVTVTYDPLKLGADEANTSKNEDIWVMEGDSVSYTDPAVEFDHTNGKIKIKGGRLTGFTGDTRIGSVTFNCLTRTTDTTPAVVNIELNPAPYDDFVDADGTVLDSTITTPLPSCVICIVDPGAGDPQACETDANGDGLITNLEKVKVIQAFNHDDPDPAYNPAVDCNGDGRITNLEKIMTIQDFNRQDCPKCWE
ncbi:MAG: hypothetical protein ACMUIP_09285 [bacterium]